MLTAKPDDYVPLSEIPKRYAISRRHLYRLVREGRLTLWRRLGDRRSYLRQSELDQAMQIRQVVLR